MSEQGSKRKRRKTSGSSKSSNSHVLSACQAMLQNDATLSAMAKLIDENSEPYYHTNWRHEPWPVRPYQLLDSYQVADDAGEAHDVDILQQKMRTSQVYTGPADQPLEEAALKVAHPKFATPAKHEAHTELAVESGEAHMGNGCKHEAANGAAHREAADSNAHIAVLATRLNVPELPTPLQLGVDVEERPVWGMDCYTRRVIFDALGLCHAFAPSDMEPQQSQELRNDFIEHKLLPAVQRQGDMGWDIQCAISDVRARAEAGGEAAVVAACEHLSNLIDTAEAYHALQQQAKAKSEAGTGGSNKPESEAEGMPQANGVHTDGTENNDHGTDPKARSLFRLHPKGQGILCIRKGGIPAGTCVAEYLGEVYAPWRWFEKQDILKKQNPTMGLPDFYNITLERPKDHPGGFDVMFIEAAHKGNFASRLCHSCMPNCHNVPVAAAGKLTNVLFTSRHIQEGEELCWDYSCVTESEKEYHAAVCLCGTAQCRGSFLQYANSSSFMEVMSREHAFLERNAAIIRAVSEDATPEDRQLLREHGICSSALDSEPQGGTPPPPWVIKWATLILRYILREFQELPEALLKKDYGYDKLGAAIEAEGVKENRLQNLAITIDKIKYFLRHQTDALKDVSPLRVLSHKEVAAYLWNDKQSVAKRLKASAAQHVKQISTVTDGQTPWEMLSFVDWVTAADAQAARHHLIRLAAVFKALGHKFAAAYDLCMLYANSHTFFEPTKYQGFSSQLGATKSSAVKRGDKLLDAKDGGPKRYQAGFLWGQLVGWFKQTVYDPSASLSAERRGSLSLPDPESAFGAPAVSGKYARGRERRSLLDMLDANAANMWPTGTIWSFKNSSKVYGSPMLDAALCRSKGEPQAEERWKQLLNELKSAF